MALKIDFQLTEHDGSFEVRASASGGEAKAESKAPADKLLDEIAAHDPTRIPPTTIESTGRSLFDTLMIGDVDRLVSNTLAEGKKTNTPVHFELRFDHDQVRLMKFPWEMITNNLGQFMVRDGLVDVTRYITYPQSPPVFDTTIREIPLLRVVSSPDQLPPISAMDLVIDLFDTLENASFQELMRTLLIERKPLWGLQFDGHGALVIQCANCNTINDLKSHTCQQCQTQLGQSKQIGALAFESGGNADWVSTEEFGSVLYNAQIRLVLLLACESARVGDDLSFSGLAPGLLLAGVPAVVGMQYAVLDEFANNFANSFYSILMRSYDVLDALRTARRMSVRGAWYSPVLYLRHLRTPAQDTEAKSAYHLRVIDTAAPAEVQAGRHFLVRLWIRRPETQAASDDTLRADLDIPEHVEIETREAEAEVKFDPQKKIDGRQLRRGTVEVRLHGTNCEVTPGEITLFIDEHLDAPPAIFTVQGKNTGRASLIFTVNQEGGQIASITHHIDIKEQSDKQVVEAITTSIDMDHQTQIIHIKDDSTSDDDSMKADATIRILVVDDDKASRDGTLQLLAQSNEIEIVGTAENGAIAVEMVKALAPNVVLMDIEMPVMDGIEATQHIVSAAPRTQVIMLSEEDDVQYLKGAFRAGATDFIVKPATLEELLQSIMRDYAKIPDMDQGLPMPSYGSGPLPGGFSPSPMGGSDNQGRVITVLGFKGGVGKTTVAVNLAVGLAANGAKTLLIDADVLFGDVGVFLNTRGQHTVEDLALTVDDADALEEVDLDVFLAAHNSGLKLLLAPTNLFEVQGVSHTAFEKMLAVLRQHFEYIIIDTGGAVDHLLAACVQDADRLLIVTVPTMAALKDTRLLRNEITTLEYPAEDTIVVLNQTHANDRIKQDQIAGFLKLPVSLNIPFDTGIADITNQGLPVVLQDANDVTSVGSFKALIQVVKDTFSKQATTGNNAESDSS